MASGFKLSVCGDPGRWDALVSSSPQGNVFCESWFLDALGVESERVFVESGGAILAGAVILKNGGMPLPAPYPFTMYQGVLWAPGFAGEPAHRRYRLGLEALTFLLESLSAQYPTVSFCLHHAFDDLRAFQWFHYHEPEKGRFEIQLSYTGLLSLVEEVGSDAWLREIRELRRREHERGRKTGLRVDALEDVGLFSELHDETFRRQGLEVDASERDLANRIAGAALTAKRGELLVCRTAEGRPASATLFLHDAHTGYYLFGANAPEHRASGSGTYLMIENLRRCRERGLKTVDFVGVNSPNRGDFKISFGARPAPYFTATWRRPEAREPARDMDL